MRKAIGISLIILFFGIALVDGHFIFKAIQAHMGENITFIPILTFLGLIPLWFGARMVRDD